MLNTYRCPILWVMLVGSWLLWSNCSGKKERTPSFYIEQIKQAIAKQQFSHAYNLLDSIDILWANDIEVLTTSMALRDSLDLYYHEAMTQQLIERSQKLTEEIEKVERNFVLEPRDAQRALEEGQKLRYKQMPLSLTQPGYDLLATTSLEGWLEFTHHYVGEKLPYYQTLVIQLPDGSTTPPDSAVYKQSIIGNYQKETLMLSSATSQKVRNLLLRADSLGVIPSVSLLHNSKVIKSYPLAPDRLKALVATARLSAMLLEREAIRQKGALHAAYTAHEEAPNK